LRYLTAMNTSLNQIQYLSSQSPMVSISAAALIIQLAIAAIVFAGTITSHSSRVIDAFVWTESSESPPPLHLYAWTILMVLITTIPICFSSDFFLIWKALVRDSSFTGLNTSQVISFVFIIDVIFTFIILVNTGGSRQSIFSPFCFLIPALALFLREPLSAIFIYCLLLAVVFCVTLFWTPSRATGNNFGYLVVSFASVALTTIISIISKPS